jgi:hypothetical protein
MWSTSTVIISNNRNICFHLDNLQKRLFPEFYVTESTDSKFLGCKPTTSESLRFRAEYFQINTLRNWLLPNYVLRYNTNCFQIVMLQKRLLPNCCDRKPTVSKLLSYKKIASKLQRYKTDRFRNVLLLALILCKYVSDIYTRHLRHQCKELVWGNKSPVLP